MIQAVKNLFVKLDRFLEFVWTHVMVWALVVMTLATLAQVVARIVNVTASPIIGDITRMSFTFATFAGAAVLFRGGHHIAIGFFVDKLKGVRLKVAIALSGGTTLLTACLLLYLSIPYVSKGMVQVSPATGIPMGIVYLILPCTFLSTIVFIVMHGFNPDIYSLESVEEQEGL